nr:MAG: replication initiator protein [Microviridae sp.]
MPCYNPLTAWQSPQKGLAKRPLHFQKIQGYTEIQIPCGQCIGCKLERSRQWAVRCVFEASMHEENSFLTLTFNDENLPHDKSLNKKTMQLFIKKLRKNISVAAKKKQITNKKIKYYLCGEYGEVCKNCGKSKLKCICNNYQPTLGRPHYHVCLFNHDFPDKTYLTTQNKVDYFISEELERLWPYGFHTIGELNFETAAYTARYCTKKITGNKSRNHYGGKRPEFVAMSLKPAIGSSWFETYKSDVLSTDKIIIRNGLTCKPPKYYDILTARKDPLLMERIKDNRKKNAAANAADNTRARLLVKQQIKLNKTKTLQRTYENGNS